MQDYVKLRHPYKRMHKWQRKGGDSMIFTSVYIVSFSVKNYTCFAEKATIDLTCDSSVNYMSKLMIPHGVQDAQLKVSPVCILYGANASGKTRILHALSAMAHTIVENPTEILQQLASRPDLAFYFDKQKINQPIEFSAVLHIDGELYEFGFELAKNQALYEISREWLKKRQDDGIVSLDASEEIITYERIVGSNIAINPNLRDSLRERVERESSFPTESKLLLNYLGDINITKSIIEWFSGSSFIHSDASSAFLHNIADFVDGKWIVKHPLRKLLRLLDKCIRGLELDGKHEPWDTLPDFYTKHVLYDGTSEVCEVPVTIDWESKGTQHLLHSIAPAVLRALQFGTLLFIDEYDNHFHPFVAVALINLFHFHNPNNAQLIFSTHDTFFMNKKILRAEEICFVEKDERGASRITSLYDYYNSDPESAYKVENWGQNYLLDMYAKIPDMSKLSFWGDDDE